MKNFLKGMLFSVVAVVAFIAIMLFAFDTRDKKYFKDKGTIAYNEGKWNFFYGVYGYHSLTPSYTLEDEKFDFYMYDIVTPSKKEDEIIFTEYVYMLFIPKIEFEDDFQYLRFYNEDNTYDAIRMYRYMDFNMYNTLDESFLIKKSYLVNKDYDKIGFMDGKNEFYKENFIYTYDEFNNIKIVTKFYEENNKLPELELKEQGIFPQTTHIAYGYTRYIWIGVGAGLFVILAMFGGVYLKPPFQKPKLEPTKGMKQDQDKYI